MIKIKIFRYETNDRGGPFFTLEGQLRDDLAIPPIDEEFVYGCLNEKALEEWFYSINTSLGSDMNIKDYILKSYSIPLEEIHYVPYSKFFEIMFPKKYINQET